MTALQHQCAVVGKPIAHSLSPILHNAAYQSLDLQDWVYAAMEMGQNDLGPFLSHLSPSWTGLSLTMPLKKTVQEFGTPVNRWAQELKVANTAIFDWSQSHSAPQIQLLNTDVYGIARAFEESYQAQDKRAPEHAKAVILGNGNTAISALAACAMMEHVDCVTIGARHIDKPTDLPDLAQRFGIQYEIMPLDEILDALLQADVVINTIPGEGGCPLADALETQSQHVHGTLLDVVYDPRPTALMKAWYAKGGAVIGGERMLLHQAFAQVLLMTGRVPLNSFDDLRTLDVQEYSPLLYSMNRALEEAL